MDYLQESKCPMGHFASHAYGSLGMPEEAMWILMRMLEYFYINFSILRAISGLL